MHDLESRSRSWQEAQEIVAKFQESADQVTTVRDAARRLSAQYGIGGDGTGDDGGGVGDGGGNVEGEESDEGNEGNEGDEGDCMGGHSDEDVDAHRCVNRVHKNKRADTMSCSEWVAALVRLAWRCFPQGSTIGARLSTLLEQHVLPGTLQGLRAAGLTSTPDPLKQQLDSKKVPCGCAKELHAHVHVCVRAWPYMHLICR